MPFFISRDDITTLKTDAIVNAGNRELRMGGGVCGAIFKAAGAEEMERALQGLGPISIGDAVATPGFALPARYVIHTAGPIYHGRKEEQDLLASCYRNSLLLAEKMHLSSVAFPLISSGIYGYPVEEAEQVALDAILSFLETHDMTVYLIILKERARKAMVYSRLSYFLQSHEDMEPAFGISIPSKAPTVERDSLCFDVLADEAPAQRTRRRKKGPRKAPVHDLPLPASDPIPDEFLRTEESFSHALLRMIDEKGLTDPEVYKGANLDRRLFSKIRSNENYKPRKNTILALAVSMDLSVEETENLLKKAGYTLSRSLTGDLIVLFYLQRGKPDIYEINEALFHFHQPQLGSAL